jgi:selenocysteine lyase/cysteine desulfurase
MTTIEEYSAAFDEDPGYLDFASFGPLAAAAVAEQRGWDELLRRGRHGSLAALNDQDARVRRAAASLTGFDAEQISFQPSTTAGLMHALFGLTGGVALGAGEFPSVRIAIARAAEHLGGIVPLWITEQYGQITPGTIREQLTSATRAVVVSLVDYRTGAVTDVEGVRQVIGDRLLVLDAVQGFGVVDAPYELADVVATGGRKWLRAGHGTGLLALSARALDQLHPVFSGYNRLEYEFGQDLAVTPRGAAAYQVSTPDPIAQARLAAVLESLAEVGIPAVHAAVLERSARLIALADEFGVPVASPRSELERAGIVVLEPGAERLAALTAALHNQGVSATVRDGRVRLSAHVSTDEQTFGMLRDALRGYASSLSIAGR